MSDETEIDEDDDLDEDGEEGEELDQEGLSGKQIVLFIVLPLLLLVGVGAGLYFGGVFGGGAEEAAISEDGEVGEDGVVAEHKTPANAVFYEMPELLVNLNTTGRRASFLKIKVSLELSSQEDVVKLEAVMPRIVDNFQVYLRELRTEDLRGSAGIHRLREELLARVKVAAQPATVNDVLFKEMLVQ